MALRREFLFGNEDTEYLNVNHPGWESILNGCQRWLLLNNFKIPAGYTIHECTVAISIPANYPSQPLDMAYFFPYIHRKDGQVIRQTDSSMIIDGKSFQRWSRHYSSQNPWIPDESNIATHIMAIRDWLDRALEGQVVA